MSFIVYANSSSSCSSTSQGCSSKLSGSRCGWLAEKEEKEVKNVAEEYHCCSWDVNVAGIDSEEKEETGDDKNKRRQQGDQ